MTSDPYNAFLHLRPAAGHGRAGRRRQGRDRRRRHADHGRLADPATDVPDQDADCVAPPARSGRHRSLGKLNTHEFAFGALTNEPALRSRAEPLGHRRTSAAARAAAAGRRSPPDSSTVSLGTDTAGSSASRRRSAASPASRPVGRARLRTTACSRPRRRSTRSARSPARPRTARMLLETLAGRSDSSGARARAFAIGVVDEPASRAPTPASPPRARRRCASCARAGSSRSRSRCSRRSRRSRS